MEAREVLHEIVSIERSAKKLYDEAVGLQAGYDDAIKEQTGQLQARLLEKTEKRIAEHERKQIEEADKSIEELDAQLESDMAKARSIFESSKDELALRVFRITVDEGTYSAK